MSSKRLGVLAFECPERNVRHRARCQRIEFGADDVVGEVVEIEVILVVSERICAPEERSDKVLNAER